MCRYDASYIFVYDYYCSYIIIISIGIILMLLCTYPQRRRRAFNARATDTKIARTSVLHPLCCAACRHPSPSSQTTATRTPTCHLTSVKIQWAFTEPFRATIALSLVAYSSLPYRVFFRFDGNPVHYNIASYTYTHTLTHTHIYVYIRVS